MEHNRAYHRYQTEVKKNRLIKINKHVGFNFVNGHFRKGKLHCSCPMCATKTNTKHGTYDGGHKPSELKRLYDISEVVLEEYNEAFIALAEFDEFMEDECGDSYLKTVK